MSSPFLSQASTPHLPASLSFFFFVLFRVFCLFRISLFLFPFFFVFWLSSPLLDLCALFLLFSLCLGIVLGTFASLYVGRCWRPPEKPAFIWALFLTWNDSLWHSIYKYWADSNPEIATGRNPPPPTLIHYEKPHNSTQRLFNKHRNPVPHPVLIFPTFFSWAVFTPVLLYDYTRNDVVFTFLCSLNHSRFAYCFPPFMQ